MTDSSRFPYFRTTGLTLMVDIEYSNVNFDGQPSLTTYDMNVEARAAPMAETQWAGLAVKAPIYETLPTGPTGEKSYKKLLRYSQGIVFKFSGKGIIYRVSSTSLLTVFTDFVVLLGLTTTVTGMVARFLWKDRKMIRNKCEEKLAIGSRLVEIAVKAASHAVTFAGLEKTGDTKITTEDLVKVFKSVGAPLDDEQAHAIAKMIICRSNDDETADVNALAEMDYVEYVNSMETNMLPFDEFTQKAVAFAKKKGYTKMAKVLPDPSA